MFFSVVIPLFNKEKHIERAIKSVIEQSYKKFELLIIDDGSTDSSFETASKINDARIKIIRKENGGVSSARNMGIKESQYEYIGFLDADDAWKPNFLEEIEKMIRKYPNAGAFATSYEIKKKDKVIRPLNSKLFENKWEGVLDDYFKYSLRIPLISASSVVIPKYVFDSVGVFPEGIKRVEDLDMWRRIAMDFKIAYSNNPCSIYFHDADNRACSKKATIYESAVKDADDILKQERHKLKNSFYYEEYMKRSIITKAKYLIVQKKPKEARELLRKYSNTKLNKIYFLKVYTLSFMPDFIVQRLT